MTILANFPMVSQLSEVTSDGRPSENAQMDCTAAAICAGVMWLKGIKAVNEDYNPDRFKDAAYGDTYKGGTAASAYVSFCASLGVKLSPISGIPGQLIQAIHEQINLDRPVVVTVPDAYVPASYGWTHILCMFGEPEPGQLVALD